MNKKIKAQIMVRECVRRGKLIKPKLCQECGKDSLLSGHHHKGYDRPLDVVWVCQKCHSKLHYVKRELKFYSFMKLRDKDVLEIVRLRKQGMKIVELAKRFGISIGHTSEICTGKKNIHVNRERVCGYQNPATSD